MTTAAFIAALVTAVWLFVNAVVVIGLLSVAAIGQRKEKQSST
jgi:hypothetical protein